MGANYIIETNSGDVFCGWNQLGQIVMKNAKDKYLAYRMSKTVADRNISKIENFTKSKCLVSKI